MCVYADCIFFCLTKNEHHSRYANMRKRKINDFNEFNEFNELTQKQKSKKVNWTLVEQLKIDTTHVKTRTKRKSYVDLQ
jgi:hypothetical protein